MRMLLTAALCAICLAGCGGNASSSGASRQQTDPTPAPAVSELQARLKPSTLEQAPTNAALPASLKPPHF